MPVEVRELSFKANINNGGSEAENDSGTPCAKDEANEGGAAGNQNEGGGGDNDALVDACVEKVLQILAYRKGR